MNVRKHLAGFAIFSFIVGSAILVNHFLNIPDARIPPVIRPEAVAGTVKAPVTFRVQQISLDYNRGRSYTQLSLFRQLDQPAPEKVWVMTTFFSPDSPRAESWSISTAISQPFANGNGQSVVAIGNWDLPPLLESDKPGAGYFARIYVSSESQGKFTEADYQNKGDVTDAIPVVIHWPDEKSMASSGPTRKRSR